MTKIADATFTPEEWIDKGKHSNMHQYSSRLDNINALRRAISKYSRLLDYPCKPRRPMGSLGSCAANLLSNHNSKNMPCR